MSNSLNPITAIVEYLMNEHEVVDGYVYSSHQYFHMAEKFLEMEVDILKDYNFPKGYEETGDRLFGWYCIVILQRRLYDAMLLNHFGKADQVKMMCDYLYVMEKKINEKFIAESRDVPVKHLWIN